MATNLSIQNRNLQEIAIKQKGMLADKEQQIKSMNEYMVEMRTGHQSKVSALTSESQAQIKAISDRLAAFESQCDFQDIIKVYNDQITALEAENSSLRGQFKRISDQIAAFHKAEEV